MYIVGYVRRPNSGFELLPVMSKQAGGCTTAELDRENKRMLRSAAARRYGGEPLDYTVVGVPERCASEEAAEVLMSYLMKDNTVETIASSSPRDPKAEIASPKP